MSAITLSRHPAHVCTDPSDALARQIVHVVRARGLTLRDALERCGVDPQAPTSETVIALVSELLHRSDV